MIATNDTTTTTTTTLTARPHVRAGSLARETLFGRVGLGFALVVSAILNLWNLQQNGFGNTYYSVAVQSMMQSFHNFFFASYDAGGFISVDKPPVALWLQVLSAKIFGFSGLSLLVPEALAGIAAVALIYFLVRRHFGTLAGVIAALALAVTPIAVAVERDNQTDTLLMLTLVLAAWALSLATEKARLGMLLVAMVLVGVAFNIKMLEAFIPLPAFYLLYLVAAPTRWYKRLFHLTLATFVVFGVALSWPLAVDLTPPDQRPWVGGSQHNSVLELALGYNGLGRVTGQEGMGRGGFGGPGGPGLGSGSAPSTGGFPNLGNLLPSFGGGTQNPGFGGGFGRGSGGGGMFGAGAPGPTRLFTGEMAGQWSWLIPLAIVGLLAAVVALRRRRFRDPRGQAILLWSGWLACYGVVFSMAAGIFHPYYLVTIAPAAAALVGIGVAFLWQGYRAGGWRAWLLPLGLLLTALWQVNILGGYPQQARWLMPLAFGGAIVAALPLVVTRLLDRRIWRRWAPGLVAVGMVALLLAPLSWALSPVAEASNNASLPAAGPGGSNPGGGNWTLMNTGNDPLVSYLEQGSQGYLYLVAVQNSQQASSLVLETGRPVLAAGGFMGSDPALTADKLAAMVASHEIRYVMGLGGGGGRGFGGFGGFGGGGSADVSGWIQQHCSAVSPSAYGGSGNGGGRGFGGFGGFGGGQLYDCAAPSI